MPPKRSSQDGADSRRPACEPSPSAEAELKQAEFKIAQLKEQLAAADRLKAEFVATMSHELRTPLNVVLGFGSLLADEAFGALNREQADACHKIMESTERLALLINDLLDFSKLQARTLEFHLRRVSLEQVLNQALGALQPLADRKSLTTSLEVSPDVPAVMADPDRLGQVFKHLFDNAVKFTPTGGALGARVRREDGSVVVEVWDTGIGIPATALGRLFDRFYQVDSSNTRLYGGTGIGLALVKELTERHGGSVAVESRVGAGSVFRVTLPIEGP